MKKTDQTKHSHHTNQNYHRGSPGKIFTQAILFLCISSLQTQPGFCEETYTYKGKSISKAQYDALNLAHDSGPFMHSGQYALAEPLLRQAMELSPDNPDILSNYAQVLHKLGRNEEAVVYFQKLSEMAPDYEKCYINWAATCGALGRLEDSLSICNEYLKRFPNSPRYKDMENQAATIENEIRKLDRARKRHGAGKGDDYLNESNFGQKQHWKKMPIKVFIKSGSDVPKWDESYDQLLEQAFKAWSDQSGGLVTFKFIDSEKNASIICRWTSDHKNMKNPAELGQTDTWVANDELLKAELSLLTSWPADPDKELSKENLRQTFLHEVGHSLGIRGHSSDPKDVMYFANIVNGPAELSTRDLNTLARLYNKNGKQKH